MVSMVENHEVSTVEDFEWLRSSILKRLNGSSFQPSEWEWFQFFTFGVFQFHTFPVSHFPSFPLFQFVSFPVFHFSSFPGSIFAFELFCPVFALVQKKRRPEILALSPVRGRTNLVPRYVKTIDFSSISPYNRTQFAHVSILIFSHFFGPPAGAPVWRGDP